MTFQPYLSLNCWCIIEKVSGLHKCVYINIYCSWLLSTVRIKFLFTSHGWLLIQDQDHSAHLSILKTILLLTPLWQLHHLQGKEYREASQSLKDRCLIKSQITVGFVSSSLTQWYTIITEKKNDLKMK